MPPVLTLLNPALQLEVSSPLAGEGQGERAVGRA